MLNWSLPNSHLRMTFYRPPISGKELNYSTVLYLNHVQSVQIASTKACDRTKQSVEC